MSKIVLQPSTLITPSPGTIEYDGGELYFTPLDTQRGVIPSMQYYRLNTALTGANVTTAQNILGVGVTLSSNTVYAFEFLFTLTKTAGVTSHTLNYLFGGTATFNNFLAHAHYTNGTAGAGTTLPAATATHAIGISNSAASMAGAGSINTASVVYVHKGWGTVSVNAGGTFIPQYTLSTAPGGAYTTAIGSYLSIWPIGAAGANTSVGTWA
jgi:hypothetical protein